jgi:hypothetical protein
MPPSSGAFKAADDAKVMQIDAEDPTKTVQIGAMQIDVDIHRRNKDIFAWGLAKMCHECD